MSLSLSAIVHGIARKTETFWGTITRLLSADAQDIRECKASNLDLRGTLANKIPVHVDKAREFCKQHGSYKLGDVTVNNILNGMQGTPTLLWETSIIDPLEGVRFRGYSLPEICRLLPHAPEGTAPLPEAIFWLLVTGDVPSSLQTQTLSKEWAKRAAIPPHIISMLHNFPKNLSPASQMSCALTALSCSKLKENQLNLPEKNSWEFVYEDSMDVIAKIPTLAAVIYRYTFNEDKSVPPINEEVDWISNFCNMIGINNNNEFVDFMRLYMTVYSDHDGGSAAAQTIQLVGSVKAGPYIAMAAGINCISGVLLGQAPKQALSLTKSILSELGSEPKDQDLKSFLVNHMKEENFLPGYGHPLLKKCDPRYTTLTDFAERHEVKNDPLYKLVKQKSKVIPTVFKELGLKKNGLPTADALSGMLLNHYGISHSSFYPVLFGMARSLGAMASLVWSTAMGFPCETPKSLTTEQLERIIAKAPKTTAIKKKKPEKRTSMRLVASKKLLEAPPGLTLQQKRNRFKVDKLDKECSLKDKNDAYVPLSLKEVLGRKIIEEREKIKAFREDCGKVVIHESTLNSIYCNMRNVPALLYETSFIHPDKDVDIRGFPLRSMMGKLPRAKNSFEPMPEGALWLLMTGELPTIEQANALGEELAERSKLGPQQVKIIRCLPCEMNPTVKLSIVLSSMTRDSIFDVGRKFLKKNDYWELVYEDCLNLIAKMPLIIGLIYYYTFKNDKGTTFNAVINPKKDWGINICSMLGRELCFDFVEFLRHYFSLNCDHGGMDVYTHTTHLVASALGNPYNALSSGVSAWVMEARGSEQVVRFLQKFLEENGGCVDEETVEQFISQYLETAPYIPGFGHAILKRTDERFASLFEFAECHIPSDDKVYEVIKKLTQLVPPAVKKLQDGPCPHPNNDLLTGVLLQYFGINELSFYPCLKCAARSMGVLSSLVWHRALGVPIERPKSFPTDILIKMVAKGGSQGSDSKSGVGKPGCEQKDKKAEPKGSVPKKKGSEYLTSLVPMRLMHSYSLYENFSGQEGITTNQF